MRGVGKCKGLAEGDMKVKELCVAGHGREPGRKLKIWTGDNDLVISVNNIES